MSQVVSKRLRIIETDGASADLEYNENFVIVHLPRVDKLTKTRLKEFKIYLEGLYDFVTTAGYKDLYAASDHKPTLKLAERLGFEYLGEQDNLKVYKYARSTSSNYSS